MRLFETNSFDRILDDIKKKAEENYKQKNPEKFSVKITKKKEVQVVPFPYTGPAFQLFINNKFYKSYLKNKNGSWIMLKD